MYAYISGAVAETGADYAVVDASGIGYLLYCSRLTLAELELGKHTKLYVHMHVAEDCMALYGFAREDEREMFRSLISVNRIGRKIALSVLSYLTVKDIAYAIATENAAAFDSVPGMGRKTAARLLLELKEKVDLPKGAVTEENSADDGRRDSVSVRSEAIEALVALGFDGLTSGRAVSAVDDGEFGSVEQLIKLALARATEKGGKKA